MKNNVHFNSFVAVVAFSILSTHGYGAELEKGSATQDNRHTGIWKNIALQATASSNSEFKNMPMYLASNVIDGKCSNKGHGKNFPAWGPDLIPDPWLKLEWKQDVQIDCVTIYIRCDFPPYQAKEHDSWWKSGTLEFSNGTKIPFELKKTAEAQTIAVPPQTIRWIKFTDLVPDEKKWCGFCEVEVQGEDKNEKS